MIELLKNLALALFPSQGTGEPIHVFRWRQVTALTLIGIGGVMGAHIAWACGFLVAFGFPGFASAEQVAQMQQFSMDIRAEQIDNQVIDARRAQCLAIGEGNGSAMLYNAQRLQEKLNQYWHLTGRVYARVPDCSELVSAVPAIPIVAPTPR